MKTSLLSGKIIATTAALLLVLTGCATEDSNAGGASDEATVNQEATTTESSETETAEAGAPDEVTGGDGDYAFGTDKDQIATAIESAFSGENGKARWEGDVLILSVDGDANEEMAGFTQCRVLSHIVLEDDITRIEFPNGSVECAEVLDDES